MKIWGTAREATAVLSEAAGRPVNEDYIRSLVRLGKVRMRPKDARTNEYNLNDCRAHKMRPMRQRKEIHERGNSI